MSAGPPAAGGGFEPMGFDGFGLGTRNIRPVHGPAGKFGSQPPPVATIVITP
jgi:hypothetical protein